MFDMRRREFITLLGGAATWPVAARAQQSTRLPTIGFLGASSGSERAPLLAEFRRGLAEAGYVEGRNVAIEYRWAEGRYDSLPALATGLVGLPVNVVAASDGPSAHAAKAATSTIPIVFLSGASDPVETGLVISLNRPGGNLTGINMVAGPLPAKQFGILRELVPAGTIGLLINPRNANAERDAAIVRGVARTVRVEVLVKQAASESELEMVFASLARETGAVLVNSDIFFTSHRDTLVTLARTNGIPAMYAWREFPVAGGLISYGASLAAANHQLGAYVAKILRGEKPADLPVVQPTKFELVINLKTAKALRLNVPDTLLARADEVIE